MSDVGRNDPCPCGSGKKYKKCCLSLTHGAGGKEDSIRAKVIQDLLRFFNRHHQNKLEDAEFLFWDEFVPEEFLSGSALTIAYQNFWEWIVFDYLIDEDKEKTLIDIYMENIRTLSFEERKVLTMMKNSTISLYEVQEVFPERGLLLKDLLMGGEYDVREKLATRSARKWDIIAARLLLVDGSYIMSGSVYPYPLKQKEQILCDIHEEFENFQMDNPEAQMDVFLKYNSEIFNLYWCDLILNPTPIKLHTTSGDPLLFSKALFEIRDKDTVISGLIKIKGFEREDDTFTWYDKRDKEGSATVLGRIEIKGNQLSLETNSQKRLEKGKRLILKVLPDAIVHKVDTFQDPMQAMESAKERSSEKHENELPMEIQQEFYTKFMQKHSEKWLKDKIPALHGKTPLQAVKTEEGKKKVIELLKFFENSEEHNRKEGRPFYDISWMYERLGLKRE